MIHLGNLIIVNFRDEFIEKHDAIGCRLGVIQHWGATKTSVGA
jgi:hypothetical protein